MTGPESLTLAINGDRTNATSAVLYRWASSVGRKVAPIPIAALLAKRAVDELIYPHHQQANANADLASYFGMSVKEWAKIRPHYVRITAEIRKCQPKT